MRSRFKVVLVAASSLALAAGCEEPKEIVQVAPPGFELKQELEVPKGQEAQALGEQPPGAVPPATKPKVEPTTVADSPPTPIGQPTTTKSGLTYETLREGAGQVAKSGDSVEMHYLGTLADGKKFDSSYDRKAPLPVTIGTGGVIKGWDEGVPGMKVGEKRKLVIPPDLGYGARGQSSIPPNSTLIFEVELVKINN